MDSNLPPEKLSSDAESALEYRRRCIRTVMVLTTLRGAMPERDEICRITSVGTLAPGLWVTVRFLDGSIQSFRPEKIRPANGDELATI